jgi:predicted DNA-binding protein with PD1-like motif
MISKIEKIYVLKIQKNGNLLNSLNDFVEKNKIKSGFITGLGALKKVNIGYFENKKYTEIEKDGVFEVGSCNGIISLKDEKPHIHLHVVCQSSKGETFCGHVLNKCIVYPTLEIVIFEFNDVIKRKFDDETGLFLLDKNVFEA